MTRLTAMEKEEFMKIIKGDLGSINLRLLEQIKVIWNESRNEILKEKGHDILQQRKQDLHQQRKDLQEEINRIEDEISFERLTVQQKLELGASEGKYDKFIGANFLGIPVDNQLDYEIVQRIKSKVDTDAPAKYLSDLASSVIREILMVGTFEEAQKIYGDFYSLDFRRFGVDIPPRLAEFQNDKDNGQGFMLNYVERPSLSEKNVTEIDVTPKKENKDKKVNYIS